MAKIHRPKDSNQLAKLIVEMATGERENDKDIVLTQRKQKEEAKLKGRNKFTKTEAKEIKQLLSVLRDSKREDQKKIRNELSGEYSFYITDFDNSNKGFTVNDFEKLIRVGGITII